MTMKKEGKDMTKKELYEYNVQQLRRIYIFYKSASPEARNLLEAIARGVAAKRCIVQVWYNATNYANWNTIYVTKASIPRKCQSRYYNPKDVLEKSGCANDPVKTKNSYCYGVLRTFAERLDNQGLLDRSIPLDV